MDLDLIWDDLSVHVSGLVNKPPVCFVFYKEDNLMYLIESWLGSTQLEQNKDGLDGTFITSALNEFM